MRAALASEWLKLRTVRGVLISGAVVLAGVAAMTLLAWYFVETWDALTPERRAASAMSPLELTAAQLAELCAGIVGVLAATTEYGDGSLRLTLLAQPRRARVVLAKAVTVAGSGLVAGAVAVVGTYLATRAIIGPRSIEGVTGPSDRSSATLLAAWVAIVAVMGLVGLGLGLWLRSTAGAITIMALVMFVVPIVAQAVPDPVGSWIRSLVPDALPGRVAGFTNAENSVFGDMLPPAAAAALMIAYPLVLVGIGLFCLRRRDA